MENFILSQKALIIHQNKVLVFQKEKNGTIYLDFPGGRVDIGESLENAFERELIEEIPNYKANIESIKDLLLWEMPFEMIKSDIRQLVMFKAVFVSNMPAKDNVSDEHLNSKMMDIDTILNSKDFVILDGQRRALELVKHSLNY